MTHPALTRSIPTNVGEPALEFAIGRAERNLVNGLKNDKNKNTIRNSKKIDEKPGGLVTLLEGAGLLFFSSAITFQKLLQLWCLKAVKLDFFSVDQCFSVSTINI